MDYPLLNVFWTIMWVFLWLLWLMLLFRVIGDIFHDSDLGGWAKAAWTFLVIIIPYVGVLIYLIARGRGMAERQQLKLERNQERMRAYVRETAAAPTSADELSKLADLKEHGHITDEEFQQAKTKILA